MLIGVDWLRRSSEREGRHRFARRRQGEHRRAECFGDFGAKPLGQHIVPGYALLLYKPIFEDRGAELVRMATRATLCEVGQSWRRASYPLWDFPGAAKLTGIKIHILPGHLLPLRVSPQVAPKRVKDKPLKPVSSGKPNRLEGEVYEEICSSYFLGRLWVTHGCR